MANAFRSQHSRRQRQEIIGELEASYTDSYLLLSRQEALFYVPDQKLNLNIHFTEVPPNC